MRFLGVDPGAWVTGYACIHAGPGAPPSLVEGGVVRVGGRRDSGSTLSDRLLELDGDFRQVLEQLRPDIAAVEGLFSHVKHPATAITMGHARGVILLAIRRAGVELVEIKPGEVKKFMTGNGQAKKEQVQAAIAARLGLVQPPEPPDLADAIAIALCAASRREGAPIVARPVPR